MLVRFQILLFLGILSISAGWRQGSTRYISANSGILRASRIVLAMGKGDSTDDKRRRRRRVAQVPDNTLRTEQASTNPPSSTAAFSRETSFFSPSVAPSQINFDAATSIEEMFGLGDNQLRELMDTEIPVPREDLATGKTVVQTDKDKVFRLPELTEFMSDSDEKTQQRETFGETITPKVDRRNADEYLRMLQLNPFADADETLFVNEYDILPSIFGTGQLLGIPLPYLQTGHGILVLVALLASCVYAPGNPLTECPPELRTCLQESLRVVYSINVVLAGWAWQRARAKHLPGAFWFVKTWCFGGLALYEVTQARDPTSRSGPVPRPLDPRQPRPNARR